VFVEEVVVMGLGWVRWTVDLSERGRERPIRRPPTFRPVTPCNGPKKAGIQTQHGISSTSVTEAPIIMRDSGRFQNFNFLAALHQKNTAIVIITYTTAHVQSLSSFGANVVEIFEVVERYHICQRLKKEKKSHATK